MEELEAMANKVQADISITLAKVNNSIYSLILLKIVDMPMRVFSKQHSDLSY